MVRNHVFHRINNFENQGMYSIIEDMIKHNEIINVVKLL